MSEPLNIFEAPLGAINLIEASAGTGKTYAITGLYLRLLVERGYRAGDILVVTYTRAATEELKERIHKRLLESRQAFQQETGDDPFYREMLQGCRTVSGTDHTYLPGTSLSEFIAEFIGALVD